MIRPQLHLQAPIKYRPHCTLASKYAVNWWWQTYETVRYLLQQHHFTDTLFKETVYILLLRDPFCI